MIRTCNAPSKSRPQISFSIANLMGHTTGNSPSPPPAPVIGPDPGRMSPHAYSSHISKSPPVTPYLPSETHAALAGAHRDIFAFHGIASSQPHDQRHVPALFPLLPSMGAYGPQKGILHWYHQLNHPHSFLTKRLAGQSLTLLRLYIFSGVGRCSVSSVNCHNVFTLSQHY